jgi:hypothetical protein
LPISLALHWPDASIYLLIKGVNPVLKMVVPACSEEDLQKFILRTDMHADIFRSVIAQTVIAD